jgi:glycine/D-amino acid oxidase-like deaminating enzyme
MSASSTRGKYDCARCGANLPPDLPRRIEQDGQYHRGVDECLDELARQRDDLKRRVQEAELVEMDAKRWRELRTFLTITLESMDPDGQGPFRHFLRFKNTGRNTGRLFIPGSGNVEPVPLTDALLDAAVEARVGDPNAYLAVLYPDDEDEAIDPCPKGDPDCETGDDGSCHDACVPGDDGAQ